MGKVLNFIGIILFVSFVFYGAALFAHQFNIDKIKKDYKDSLSLEKLKHEVFYPVPEVKEKGDSHE